jgi:HK97 family phage major capsid protein
MKKLEEDKLAVEMEIRSLGDDVKSGKIKAADGMTKLTELRSRKDKIEKEIAAADVQTRSAGAAVSLADVKSAMMEKRAITIGDNGSIMQVKELYKPLLAKTPLLAGVKTFYGANASTNIPILSARPAVPAAQSENATGIVSDTIAALGTRALTPHCFVSILPVTAEAIAMGSVDIEKELPAIFADSFAQGYHSSICTGDGTGNKFNGIFSGVPAANQQKTATTGAITVAELANFALNMADKSDNAVMIMNPAIYAVVMADTDTSDSTKVYKESLIRDKTIEGVKVMLTSAAPSATATGSIMVTTLELANYAMAIASQVVIEPMKQLGSTATWYQATGFANGALILPNDVYALVSK